MNRYLMILGLWAAILSETGAMSLAEFGIAMDSPVSPENNVTSLVAGEWSTGRTHSNYGVEFGHFGTYTFHGPFSMSNEDDLGVPPTEYGSVFPGGWSLDHTRLDFDVSAELAIIRSACLPLHHWSGIADSLALTTLIRFAGPVYHAAQYAESQVSNGDTLWHTPWTTLSLPGPEEPQLLWVEGVARVKGIVEGQVTLLASDSLFIMGDLITTDTILSPCSGDSPTPDTPFGMTPAGSPHRIGLIGERDVILAATLENGLGNGLHTPNLTCGWDSDPVVTACNQGRCDVIVTAAILALGCSFEAEYWKTTAWGATVPPPWPQAYNCSDSSHTHVTLWDTVPGGAWPDCPGADDLDDHRGALWFCGSLAMMNYGYTRVKPVSMWGNATIGYSRRRRAFDLNFLDYPPPYWPEVDWLDESPLEITLSTGTHSGCGAVADPAGFAEEWTQGQVQIDLVAHYEPEFPEEARPETVLILTWINGVVLDSVWTTITWETPTFQWSSSRDLTPWLEQDMELRLEIQRGAWFTLPDSSGFFEPLFYWNANGEECSWSWNATAVETPPTPLAFSLSQPWPNPFNPVTQVELMLTQSAEVTLEVHDLLGRRVTLLHAGVVQAGTHSITIDGSDWAAGLHLLTLRHAGAVETRKLLLLK